MAIRRIISADEAATGADDLACAADFDNERGAERECSLGSRIARRFPTHVARARVERDDEWVLGSVATEHQQVVHQRRRAAVAVQRGILQRGLSPEDFSRTIERRRAHMPKMNVESAMIEDWCRAGRRVFLVHRFCAARLGLQDLDVPKNRAVNRVHTERAQ